MFLVTAAGAFIRDPRQLPCYSIITSIKNNAQSHTAEVLLCALLLHLQYRCSQCSTATIDVMLGIISIPYTCQKFNGICLNVNRYAPRRISLVSVFAKGNTKNPITKLLTPCMMSNGIPDAIHASVCSKLKPYISACPGA